jgi:hypothetical protein
MGYVFQRWQVTNLHQLATHSNSNHRIIRLSFPPLSD